MAPSCGEVIDVHPTFFIESALNATDGYQQVGGGYTTGATQHAAVWNGTAESAIDLNPAGFDHSVAYGVSRNQQVGTGGTTSATDNENALLWTGTAHSVVDLNPLGFSASSALGSDGQYQVGAGTTVANGSLTSHALLWNGTADSFVDLHNDSLAGAFNASLAYGVGGGQQVGYLFRTVPSEYHAAVWNGSPETAVDLNPVGAKTSQAYAADGHIQIGFATFVVQNPPEVVYHATLWKGTADSAINLNDFLLADWAGAGAYSIDVAGNIYGLGTAADGATHAIEWVSQAANLANISTRASVRTGDDVLIAGFIITGTQSKPVLIRGLGPSLLILR